MKKRITTLCLLLAAALLCPTVSGAAASPADNTQSEVYAAVDLTGGESLLVTGAPDGSLMRAADDYELFAQEEPVLSVEHLRGAAGDPDAAYFSVDFTLPDSEVEVFLTGLTAENVEEVQQTILDSFVRGEDFSMTDIAFIDAEKTDSRRDGDDVLCWAASAANMLVYTGWAAQAGFESEDDVFEAFIRSYEDTGGNPYYAMAWFFNGAALGRNFGLENARITDYPRSGAYLTDFAFDQYTGTGDFYVDDMDTIVSLLRAGHAVGLGVDVMKDNSSAGAHAITLWGYAIDNSLPATDPARYLCMFVTDSDSDELTDADRRSSPNVLHVLTLTKKYNYYDFTFATGQSGRSIFYVSLAPCRADAPRETDPAATKNKRTTPDLTIDSVYLTDTNRTKEQTSLFERGTKVYYGCSIVNSADKAYTGSFYLQATITAADGTVKYRSAPVKIGSANRMDVSGSFSQEEFLLAPRLGEGDYTLTLTVNPDHTASGAAAEAYYCNNSRCVPLKVRGSYLLGDFDGSGAIDILDATAIQRQLAGIEDYGARGVLRGCLSGDELSILDATAIQRCLAGLEPDSPIGSKRLYP